METAVSMFMRYGIKSVSMDDIAREMGMSKKTLYQYVNDKRDLVLKAVNHHFEKDQEECDHVLLEDENAIVQMLNISRHVSQSLSNLNPSTLYDLQKYYPEGWKLFDTHRQDFIVGCVESNIRNGMASGLYRDDVDPVMAAKLYITLIEGSMKPNFLPDKITSHGKIVKIIIDYHLHAMLSDAGRTYLSKHLEAINSTK